LVKQMIFASIENGTVWIIHPVRWGSKMVPWSQRVALCGRDGLF
jgi:hypothetical protein